jgi:glycosyltransferase involved in cell wall biosynthesis
MQTMPEFGATPLVSVCIPTYNRSALLRQALDSVLQQTLTNIEIIVADNASPDDTQALIASYRDSRIHYIRNAKNVGHRENCNLGMRLTTGKYIAILPDDDIMLPENLRRKMEVLEDNRHVGLVHSKYHLIDAEGQITRRNTNWGHGPERSGDIMEDRERILTAPFNLINWTAALFRRECYQKLGGFTDSIQYAFDWEWFMRIAVYWDIYFLEEALVQWRIHGGSIGCLDVNQEIVKLREDLAAKRSLCDKDLGALANATALKKQMAKNIAPRVVAQAEKMVWGGVPNEEIWAFLRESYCALPNVFHNRQFWKLSLECLLRGSKHIPAILLKRAKLSISR